jgi:hypothetical protein
MASTHLKRNALGVLSVWLLIILSIAGTAAAQSAGTGSLSGRVTDERGGSVVGAKVTVRNVDTNATRELTTNDAGDYRAVLLQPDNYEVAVQMQGFAALKTAGIRVDVGSTVTLDLVLKVAAVAQEVMVTSATPILEPEKMESSQVVDQNLVENLPINGRRWTDFVLLTPGVSTDGGFGLVSYRGISSLYNNNTVDGADNNQAFFSEARGRTRIAYAYSMQTIKEFQVTDSNYSAEFGRSAGGIVNAVTKSGTNAFHGGVFWYLRHFKGIALDPFSKAQAIQQSQASGNPPNFVKSEKIRHQFGGDFGGPLLKDKLFFYFAYDGQRRSFPGTVAASQGYFNTVAIPTSCPPVASAAQCSAAIAFLQASAGGFERTGNQDIYFGKVDYQLSRNNRLSGSLNWQDWDSPNGFLTGVSTSSTVTDNGHDTVRSRFVVADLTSTMGSNVVNDFRFQYGQDFEADTANGPGPAVSLTSGLTYGLNSSLPRTFFPDERRYQFTDTFSIIKGKHAWKTGADINLVHEKLANLFQGNGTYSYGTSVGAGIGSPCTNAGAAFAFCNWVLDVYQIPTTGPTGKNTTGRHYTSFAQVNDPITGLGLDDFWQNNVGLFVQDTWKIRPKLTLNYGLRYDVQLIPQPPRPNSTTPLAAAATTRIPIDKNNFGPRVSIAWEALPKTVVRVGYGLYYGQTSNSVFYTVRSENGVFQQTFNCGPTTTCAPTFPNVIFTPPGPALAAPFSSAVTPQVVNTNPSLSTQVIRGLSPDFVNPLVHMGEFVIEREVGWNSSFSASYLFSRGLRLPVFVDANLAPATTTRTYDVVDSGGNTLSTFTLPLYTSRASTGTGGGVVLVGESVVNSAYHALTLSYNKRISHGFETIANYTYSKAIDSGQVPGTFGTFNGTDVPLDPMNINSEHALSDLDQRNHFVWSFVYALPFEHSSNAFTRRAFGGLGFSGILTLGSGRPVTAQMSNSPNCAGTADFGLTCGEVSSNGGFTSGRVGQIGRNTFLSPSLKTFDFRVERDIKFEEKYQLRILVEAFNLTNTTNVTTVSSTAFTVNNPSGAATAVCKSAVHTNSCIAPFTGTPFLSPTATSNTNIGARQLQLSLRFSF